MIHKKQIQKLKINGKTNYAFSNAPCNRRTQPSADISHHRWVKQKFELAPSKNNTLLQTISRIFFTVSDMRCIFLVVRPSGC